ncbi:uncharacterized protein LOC131670567 [Phymastichus coffea]|uniref:uncharacterized protein LOC131670567 n=1 Tax=Phymastichus coffea TaxID=108790 RepID=UPI00273C8C7E|nr:uncharacterized protein LOC131670567 [Phymastichus coffea]
MLQSNVPEMRIDVDGPAIVGEHDDNASLEQELAKSLSNFVIPRPSLVVSSTASKSSDNRTWESPSRGSTASSTQSAASGTLLLTAANLANLAKLHPPTLEPPKQLDSVSVASSTHFTVVNGLGRPSVVKKKSWCARNQLTVLVCSTSLLFMLGLLLGVLYMDMRVRTKYN